MRSHCTIILLTAFLTFSVQGFVHAHIITVGPGESIQAAIDSTNAGDLIEVQSAIYRENLYITKPLALQGLGYPVLDADGKGSAVYFLAKGISLQGFKLTRASAQGAGINVSNVSNNNIIKNNIIQDNGGNGIDLWASENNSIEENTIKNNGENGIGLWSCEKSRISKNDITENNGTGIIGGSSNGSIEDNNLGSNGGSGMVLLNSFSNNISHNRATENQENGIMIIFSSENRIAGNRAHNSSLSGISLLFSWQNDISDNEVLGNMVGLQLGNSSENNQIFDNQVVSNRLGISISLSSQNVIYHNYFGNNSYDSYDEGENQWDDGVGGNFYLGWTCEDLNGDGICDSSLNIPGGTGVDRYPLASWSSQ
jgi:parallel beta-helix repeat protein